ncbi:hypothetical protein [Salinibacillus xinjiangensis]|uniref:Uncharacterized protein n=1 Tax=Salinibacillus xinjiangensis TaxID=1229268 RepID=A0A6G1X757_9BACI|nr:hypothetical protein [Salinibacillus xinjiangensis]MRG86710.1 hypothetical protein [Salinibacillus xinjiangensis]
MSVLSLMSEDAKKFIKGKSFITKIVTSGSWIDHGDKSKGWVQFTPSFIFIIGFTNKPVVFISVGDDEHNKYKNLHIDEPSPLKIVEYFTELVCSMFPSLHWKQQRELLLDIGKKVKEKYSDFNSDVFLQKSKTDEVRITIELSGESEVFTDVQVIEDCIEKERHISTD